MQRKASVTHAITGAALLHRRPQGREIGECGWRREEVTRVAQCHQEAPQARVLRHPSGRVRGRHHGTQQQRFQAGLRRGIGGTQRAQGGGGPATTALVVVLHKIAQRFRHRAPRDVRHLGAGVHEGEAERVEARVPVDREEETSLRGHLQVFRKHPYDDQA